MGRGITYWDGILRVESVSISCVCGFPSLELIRLGSNCPLSWLYIIHARKDCVDGALTWKDIYLFKFAIILKCQVTFLRSMLYENLFSASQTFDFDFFVPNILKLADINHFFKVLTKFGDNMLCLIFCKIEIFVVMMTKFPQLYYELAIFSFWIFWFIWNWIIEYSRLNIVAPIFKVFPPQNRW